MIVYPMGLPPHEPIRMELEQKIEEAVAGKQVHAYQPLAILARQFNYSLHAAVVQILLGILVSYKPENPAHDYAVSNSTGVRQYFLYLGATSIVLL